jgi:hypothetical protein
MSVFCRVFYNFELEDKTRIILKDMYKLLCLHNKNEKKEGE